MELRTIRRMVLGCALALLGLALVRISFVDGIVRRVTIDGASMAPRLQGVHFEIICRDCRFGFAIDAEHLPTESLAACPNCGFTENEIAAALPVVGQRVLIDRWPLLWRTPRRGDIVAFSLPERNSFGVKRVVGLPGERLTIQGGDLFADDQIIRKTSVEFEAVKQFVHDNSFSPQETTGLPSRWRPAIVNSHWRPTAQGFAIEATPASQHQPDWLEYENWKCTADASSRGKASPVLDNDYFNQGDTNRPLNAVHDVLLSCRVLARGDGAILLAALDGNQRFEIEILPKKQVVLRYGLERHVNVPLKTDFSIRPVSIDFGLCDCQVLVALDGRPILRQPYDRPAEASSEPLHVLSIGSAGISIQLERLQVWRDLYYLDPKGLSRHWALSQPLQADEYAVLGDNPPVSLDSRHFEPAGIRTAALLGRVYRPKLYRTQRP